MSRHVLILILMLILPLTWRLDAASAEPAPTQPVVPLATTDPEPSLEDLGAFGEMVGDARIVALGEATHGTREIFRMKHRLLRYLVEEKGFTIFSIEASMPEAYAVDPYVQGGEGDAEALIGGMYFWTWHTHEVLDLVDWMRRHNSNSARRPVRFTGFDMQQPYNAAATVWDMAGRLDAGLGRDLRRAYRNIRSVDDLDEIDALLSARHPELADFYSAAELAWLEQCARLVRQGVVRRKTDQENMRQRDRHMAENVAWIAEQNPGSRIVIWAHNMHVSRAEGWMGAHLAQWFGDDYLPVGFALGTGRYRAVDMDARRIRDAPLREPPGDSVEAQLAIVGHPLAVFDLRSAGMKALRQERPMRSIGSAIVDEPFKPVRAADLYDLLIYIEHSSPSRPLRGRAARAPSL